MEQYIEIDYANERLRGLTDKTSDDVIAQVLDQAIKDDFGSQFELYQIKELYGPAGGWPNVIIRFTGSKQELFKILTDRLQIDENEVEDFLVK